MSAEQMGKARDKEVLKFLTVMVQRQRERLHNPFQGGMSEAAHAFGQFAKAHPDRAARIIPRLTPGDHDLSAGDGLRSPGEARLSTERVIALAIELDRRGFGGEDFRVNAALALGACAKEGVGLPDAACELLGRWLAEPWQMHEAPDGQPTKASEKEERIRPLLWGQGAMISLPFGPYHLLRALTYGYLLRDPPAADRWMSLLELQVERTIEVEAWRVFSRDLRYLHLCDPLRAERFLRRLFERYPGVRDSLFGALLLTHVWWYLPRPTTRQMLLELRDGSWLDCPQAFGELLALRCLVFPDDHGAVSDLEVALQADGELSDKLLRIRAGLAFTAAHLWRDPSRCSPATEMLVRLMPQADRRVGQGIMYIFPRADPMLADRETERLLRTLHAHPTVLKGAQGPFFAERLEDLFLTYPDVVFDLCVDVAQLWEQELGSPRAGSASATAHFTNMALAFQRLDGAYRVKGLDLFERLLDIGVHDAFMTLQELDRWMPNLGAPVHRPSITRRGRKATPP
jgi:hypothetical protein